MIATSAPRMASTTPNSISVNPRPRAQERAAIDGLHLLERAFGQRRHAGCFVSRTRSVSSSRVADVAPQPRPLQRARPQRGDQLVEARRLVRQVVGGAELQRLRKLAGREPLEGAVNRTRAGDAPASQAAANATPTSEIRVTGQKRACSSRICPLASYVFCGEDEASSSGNAQRASVRAPAPSASTSAKETDATIRWMRRTSLVCRATPAHVSPPGTGGSLPRCGVWLRTGAERAAAMARCVSMRSSSWGAAPCRGQRGVQTLAVDSLDLEADRPVAASFLRHRATWMASAPADPA